MVPVMSWAYSFSRAHARMQCKCVYLKYVENWAAVPGAATTYLGIENGMIPNVVVQIATMYCHGRFSPKVAEHLHSTKKTR